MPPFRIVRPCVPILQWVASVSLSHHETRRCPRVVRYRGLSEQSLENSDMVGIFEAAFGKMYYAVIRKDTPETSAQGSSEARFAGTKGKAG